MNTPIEKYRLGIDLGATSLGWAIYDIENNRIVDSGVRIFDDGRNPKTKASKCVERREARGSRRLVSRRTMKKGHLIKALSDTGLFPTNKNEQKALEDLNPYAKMRKYDDLPDDIKKIVEKACGNKEPKEKDKTEIQNTLKKMPLYVLRAKALEAKLDHPYQIGRILIQLGQRKGFLSNRKDDQKIAKTFYAGNERLQEEKENLKARTYGEYLCLDHINNSRNNIRLKKALNEEGGAKNKIAFPYRNDYMYEFDKIWKKQREFYPELLNKDNKERIKRILFFQRPLKEQEVGWCSLEPGEKRIAKAHPLYQEFRIREVINNIRITADGKEELLNSNERETLFNDLYGNPEENISLTKICELLKLPKDSLINYGDFGTKKDNGKIPQNETELAIKSGSKELQHFWHNLDEDSKGDLMDFLSRPGDFIEDVCSIYDQKEEIVKHLQKNYKMKKEVAEDLLKIQFEDEYGSLSKKAIEKILPGLREGLSASEARKQVGYNHSEHEKRDVLPYYGELLREHCFGAKDNPRNVEEKFGRINNATVHVALNQVRLVVNELIRTYGKPFDISIEYARDLNASAEERLKMLNHQNKNRDNNNRIRKKIKENCDITKPSIADIEKYKIWETCKKKCPYSGKIIPERDLFKGNYEVDHILPFSRTFDDSINNKIVCFRKANEDKGDRTPYEAFGQTKEWKQILKNIEDINKERYWRFLKDAMNRFDEMESPIARFLTDNRYMTKILKDYILPIVDKNGYKTVQSVKGALTAMLREVWGLNALKDKNNPEEYRAKHYHHAIDAIVIASITRGQVEKICGELKRQKAGIKENIEYEFRNERWKLDPKNRDKTSNEEIAKLKKQIKQFWKNSNNAIVARCVKKPLNLDINDVEKLVSQINISHKPNLKRINDPKSTVRKLHEDTAYGLSSISKNLMGTFHSKSKEEDGKNSEESTKEKKVKITTYIPIFKYEEDRAAYFDAYKKWFIAEVEASEKEQQKAKTELCEAAKKAFKWHVSGNCFCLAVYEILSKDKDKSAVETKLVGEVVSNYNATIRSRRDENISYLAYAYPNAKEVMTLRQNGMVQMTFKVDMIKELPEDDRVIENGKIKEEKSIDKNGKEKKHKYVGHTIKGFYPGLRSYLKKKIKQTKEKSITVLFRVKKMDASGLIYFIPHDIARELSPDDTSLYIYVSSFDKYKLRKVYVTPAGKIKEYHEHKHN